MYNNGVITVLKQVGIFYRLHRQAEVMKFDVNDIKECRNGEIKGYASVMFILKNGEIIDVSLKKDVADYFLKMR
ncbi:MAG: hypothetical protein IKJ88_07720 [Clostridia bacterium]|nr:hypothetical protein [Clostridia bacterium]